MRTHVVILLSSPDLLCVSFSCMVSLLVSPPHHSVRGRLSAAESRQHRARSHSTCSRRCCPPRPERMSAQATSATVCRTSSAQVTSYSLSRSLSRFSISLSSIYLVVHVWHRSFPFCFSFPHLCSDASVVAQDFMKAVMEARNARDGEQGCGIILQAVIRTVMACVQRAQAQQQGGGTGMSSSCHVSFSDTWVVRLFFCEY